MDLISKSITAIQQKANSLGKRVTSNFGWAGQQAQQNIVRPVQQMQRQVFTPQNISAFQKGFNVIPKTTISEIQKRPLVAKALEGFGEASTFGIKDIPYRPSQNLGEKAAYTAGYIGGVVNPLNPINKLGAGIKATGLLKPATQLLESQAGKFIAQGGVKAIAGRGLEGAAQGLPLTTAYLGAKTALEGKPAIGQAPQEVAFDVGVGTLGAIPFVGGLARATKGKVKAKDINTVADSLMSESERIAVKLIKQGNDIPTVMTKLMNMPNIDQRAVTNIIGQADKIVKNPIMYLVDKVTQTKDRNLLRYVEEYVDKTKNTDLQSVLNEVRKGIPYTTEEILPATKRDLANYAKLRSGELKTKVQEIANSTPLNTAKTYAKAMVNEAKKYDEKLAKDVDTVFGKLTLKSKDITQPFESIKPGKGTYTKLDLDNLNTAYRNIDAGLPSGGLNPLASKKRPWDIVGSAYNYFLNESRNTLKKMGQAGQEISKRIDDMYDVAERKAGVNVADVQKVTNNMDNATFEEVTKALKGKQSAIDPTSDQVVEIRRVLDNVRKDALEVGLEVGKIENYFPQVIDKDKLKGLRNETAEYLMKTKQFSSYEKATAFLDDIINGTPAMDAYERFIKPLPKKMGNLEFERMLDLPDNILRTDKKVLADYIEQAYSRIEQVRQFGKNNELGEVLLTNLSKQNYDKELAKTILDQNLGLIKYNKKAQTISKLAREFQGLTKLGLAAITNATQTVNILTPAGVKRTMSDIYKYAQPKYRAEMDDFALRTGATLKGTMQQIMDQWKGQGTISQYAAPFFGKVETWLRTISANTGRRYALDLLEQIKKNPNDIKATKELQRLIPNVDLSKVLKNGTFAADDLLKAGQTLTNRTNFKTRPIDLPPAWDTPVGKAATQFKSFGFRQGIFVKKELIEPLLKRDPAPLIRFILFGTLVNELTNNMKSIITQRDRPEDIYQRILEDIPGMGFYPDFVEAVAYGMQTRDGLYDAMQDFVTGPTGSDIRKGVTGLQKAYNGNIKPLAKEVVSKVPILGRTFINMNPQLFTSSSPKTDTLDQTNVSEFTETLGTSLLDKQKLDDQLSAIKKEQKEIADQVGINLPMVGTLNQMTDQEKIMKMNEKQTIIDTLEKKKDEIESLEDYNEKLQKFTKLPTSEINAITQKYEAVKLASTILSDETISTDKKLEYISKLPISYMDAIYYNNASMPTEVKQLIIQNGVQDLVTQGQEDKILDYLAEQRRSVAGKMMLTDSLVNDLVDQGLISKEQGTLLKNTTISSTGQKIVKASKGKKVAFKNVSIPKIKAIKASKATKLKSVKVPKFKALKVPKIGKIKAK